jgi:diguanylate cyclase
MPELTDEVLRQALGQCSRWWRSGWELSVAVNLSASTVVNAALPDMLAEHLAMTRLPARAPGGDHWRRAHGQPHPCPIGPRQIRENGIEVALDDFGSGYSSLAYLRELPVDVLKLDRSFVTPMSDDRRAAALVHSAVELAHSLGWGWSG